MIVLLSGTAQSVARMHRPELQIYNTGVQYRYRSTVPVESGSRSLQDPTAVLGNSLTYMYTGMASEELTGADRHYCGVRF